MGPLWAPACTGYPGADNNADNNYDGRDSGGHEYLALSVKTKKVIVFF
jgi:hypothetical protein